MVCKRWVARSVLNLFKGHMGSPHEARELVSADAQQKPELWTGSR